MKLTNTILAICISSSCLFAQNNQDVLSDSVKRNDGTNWTRRKNVINVNLSSMLISHFGISYERVLTNKMSVRLYGDIASLNLKLNDYDINMKGFGILPEFRYYVSHMGAPYNYFIGVYGVIRSYTFDGAFTDAGKRFVGDGSFRYYGFGFVNGPQFILGNRITLAIPFGLSLGGGNTSGNFVYTDTNSSNGQETKNADIPFVGGSAIMPRFGVELGIAF